MRLLSAEYRGAALDEGLDTFLEVFAVEHAIPDLGNVVDCGPLAALDELQCGFLCDLNSDRRIFAIVCAISIARWICWPGLTTSWTRPIL